MDRGLRGAWQKLVNVAVGFGVVVLLVGAGAAVAVLWADQITLYAYNAGPAAVTVSGCGDDVTVPPGGSTIAQRVCWRVRELTARSDGAPVERVAVPRSGAWLWDVGGRGGLLLVDYSAAYAQANEYQLPPDAEARVVADLRTTHLVSVARVHAVLDPGKPLPHERVVGSKVLRLERAPAGPAEIDAAALGRHFSEAMRLELTPASMRPVRLDFKAAPQDAPR